MHLGRFVCTAIVLASVVGCDQDSTAENPAPIQDVATPQVTVPADAGSDSVGSRDASPSSASADAGGPSPDAGATQPVAPPDYASADNWLCRPGHNDACAVDLDTTVVAADGGTQPEPFRASAEPPIDCFYVYPTVSLDTTPNSDLVPGPEEKSVVRAQLARFASQCRLFAPVYRQVTLGALRTALAGGAAGTLPKADSTLGLQDVLAAWNHYLEHDNQGRGVVFVGHSQGSSVLTQLLKQKLDAAAPEPRFITAVLAGANVLVPKGQRVGGTFKTLPLCASADELGCIITFASFRETSPPPPTSLFAVSNDPNLVAGCTNPAAISGGSGELHAYLTKDGPGSGSSPMGPWAQGVTVNTPFVSVPGLLSASCTEGATGSYLAIHVHADPADPRTDEISGDVVQDGKVQAGWGLHLLDMHLTMGNLLDAVPAKAKAYAKK
jgi:hypothetical protein